MAFANKNLFLNDFTDELADRYRRSKSVTGLSADGSVNSYQRYIIECTIIWGILNTYHSLILNRPRFRAQASYCRKVMSELDPQLWDAMERYEKEFRAFKRKNKGATLVDFIAEKERLLHDHCKGVTRS